MIKEKLVFALIVILPNWSEPFEIMYDASDYVVRGCFGSKERKDV